MQAMEISLSALDVEWKRLETISENLANINSARGKDGVLYREKHLVSGPRQAFSTYMDQAPGAKDRPLQGLGGVDVYGVEDNASAPPRLVHEPANPAADANGMVAYPNIDHAGQMLLMVKTSRAYEANIVAMNAARDMYSKALNLGKRS
jgi:flagellar basal-body rod protein FlgC